MSKVGRFESTWRTRTSSRFPLGPAHRPRKIPFTRSEYQAEPLWMVMEQQRKASRVGKSIWPWRAGVGGGNSTARNW
ncbi:unnamed protein product, partial [Nesidiocoris tenuis]